MNEIVPEKQIIAHVRTSDMAVQTNSDHCLGVARLASRFANDFGWGDAAYVMGMLHDKGKEQEGFQRYIRRMSGYENVSGFVEKTPHAFVGTLLAVNAGRPANAESVSSSFHLCDFIGMPIAGHHAGLYDWMDYRSLCDREIPPDVNISEAGIKPVVYGSLPPKSYIHHLVRMLFSSLVDADYLDTEAFMQPGQSAERCRCDSLEVLQCALDKYLDGLNRLLTLL